MLNDTPGRVGPPIKPPPASVRDYFLTWLDDNGYPLWPFWEHIRRWWDIRHLPNLLIVHYADLKADLPGEMRRIAAFLDIEIDERVWPTMLRCCSFEHMKRNGSSIMPIVEKFLHKGAETFINKGTNGRWRDVLTAQDIRRYEQEARTQLGEACAAWLAEGTELHARHDARQVEPVRSDSCRAGGEIAMLKSDTFGTAMRPVVLARPRSTPGIAAISAPPQACNASAGAGIDWRRPPGRVIRKVAGGAIECNCFVKCALNVRQRGQPPLHTHWRDARGVAALRCMARTDARRPDDAHRSSAPFLKNRLASPYRLRPDASRLLRNPRLSRDPARTLLSAIAVLPEFGRRLRRPFLPLRQWLPDTQPIDRRFIDVAQGLFLQPRSPTSLAKADASYVE